ncbi:AgmX/PglI C-terminal domain-containing protein [Myxococcus hansupus]|uniref:AgmX/PglI C-terminal domain-containing protein n=1 Tax=Pseudomyxococcus hansupus TaxID=1297742 RepID=UPI000272AF3B|nr:AgmX/PglI C-terminal domain-containing protein [Myxococcus hansupus]
MNVNEVLAGDLDAYLDRELFESESSEDVACDTSSVAEVSGGLRVLLTLAEEETAWMTHHPPSTAHVVESPPEPAVEIPEWMRTSPGAKHITPLGSLLLPLGEDAWSRAAHETSEMSQDLHAEASQWDGVSPPTGWGKPVTAAGAQTHGTELRPAALMGAAAVGALAAGLLLVAVLSVREGSAGTTQARSVEAARVSDVDSSKAAALPGHLAEASAVAPLASVGGAVSQPPVTGAVSSSQVGAVPLPAGGNLQSVVEGLRPAASSPQAQVRAPVPHAETLAVAQTAPIARKVRANAAAAAAVPTTTPAAPVEFAFGDDEAGGSTAREGVQSSPGEVVADAVEADASPKGPYSDLDEEFARELGFTDEAEAEALKAEEPSRTVYVPPALDVKEHLTPEDVKQVVVTNQPAITACLRSHAQGSPVEAGGRFVMQWSVLPSGETLNVSMDTSALRATPLARCVEDVVRRWKFPVHQVRMQEPIRFPFVF